MTDEVPAPMRHVLEELQMPECYNILPDGMLVRHGVGGDALFPSAEQMELLLIVSRVGAEVVLQHRSGSDLVGCGHVSFFMVVYKYCKDTIAKIRFLFQYGLLSAVLFYIADR